MNEVDKRILAGRIKDLRLLYEETQEQFAARMHVPVTRICSWEVAATRPSLDETTRLHELALNIGKYDLAAYFKDRREGLRQWQEPLENYRRETEGKR